MLINGRHAYLPVIVLVAVILVGALTSLEFNYHFGNGAFQRDYFRHFHLNILPVFADMDNLASLFRNHHSSPLLHLHQMIAIRVSDGSLRGNAYVGIAIFSLIALYLGLAAYRGLVAQTGSKSFGLTIAVTVALLISGLTAAQPVEVPLIYLQSYFFALGVMIAVCTYRLCTQPMSGRQMWLYLCVVMAAIILHSSFGTLFALASFIAIAMRVLARGNYSLLAPLLVALAFTYLWNAHVLPGLGHKNPPRINPLNYLPFHLDEVPFMIAAFGKSLLAGFHGDAYSFDLTRSTLGRSHAIVFILVAMAYLIVTLWALARPRNVMIAGIIMLAILLSMSAVPFTRWATSFPYKLDATRYIFMYKLAAAAFVWSSADAMASLLRRSSPDEAKITGWFMPSTIAVLLLFAITVLHYRAYQALEKHSPNLTRWQADNELGVYMLGVDPKNSYSLRRWLSGGNQAATYEPVISWLAQEKLNVFSPRYRATRQIRNYKLGRSIYLSANKKPLPLEINTKNCVEHAGFPVEQAWNLDIDSSYTGRLQLDFFGEGNTKLLYPLRIGRHNFYGIFPPMTPLRMCFPVDTRVKSITHLPTTSKTT